MKTNDKPRIDGTILDSKINCDNPHIIPIVKLTKILLKVAEKYFFLYKKTLHIDFVNLKYLSIKKYQK